MPQEATKQKEYKQKHENIDGQHQDHQPGLESEMDPKPEAEASHYRGSGKLKGKRALITGGDSGIGRAVAILFAREGADVAINFLSEEEEDAGKTRRDVEAEGVRCLMVPGDVRRSSFCTELVRRTAKELGGLDILVCNAAFQQPQDSLQQITDEQLLRTYETNILSNFYLTRAALDYLGEGSSIILTTSVTAYRGSKNLLDYSSTKAAQVGFLRSLSQLLAEKKIRVNGVAPGPIWTPLIPATFPPDKVEEFGSGQPLGRAGQPEEVAPAYVYLASTDASYVTGQVIHVNGGEVING